MTDEIQKIEYLLAAKLRKLLGEDVEEIHRDDCRRLDDLAITQPVNSVEIIQPVQAVPRCKTKSGRQASNLATISKRPKNKPKIQKGVKKSTDGCNTGLD